MSKKKIDCVCDEQGKCVYHMELAGELLWCGPAPLRVKIYDRLAYPYRRLLGKLGIR